MESPTTPRAREAEPPKAMYTTAGTVYNPKSTQPMQPPNRRGRSKWVLDGMPSSELSLLPKSALSALNLRGVPRSDTDTLPKYSPLQQNMDRAVSPSSRNQQQPPQQQQQQQQHHLHQKLQQDTMGLNISPDPVSPPAVVTTRPWMPLVVDGSSKRKLISTAASPFDNDEDAASNDQGLSEGDSENPLRGLSVKSLHNLASYPNPHQKRAQKTLLGGRPISSGGAPLFSPEERLKMHPMRPVVPGQTPSTARPDNTYCQITEPKPSAYYTQISRYSSTDVFYKPAADTQDLGGGYKTTLAQGPGAPKPLTAGPPGLRQHTPAMEAAHRALRENYSRSHPSGSASDDSTVMPGYDGFVAEARRADPLEHFERERRREVERDMAQRRRQLEYSVGQSGYTRAVETQISETSRHLMELRSCTVLEPRTGYSPRTEYSGAHGQDVISDTKLPGDIAIYYPDGLPAMNMVGEVDPEWLEQDHATERTPWNRGTWMNSTAATQRRNQRSLRQFYAGYAEMCGDMDHVIKEAERRQDQRALGVIGDRRPKPEVARPEMVSIERVNALPTSEATKPILNMVFSTLIRNAEQAGPGALGSLSAFEKSRLA